jgi:vacuolar-type H+-ATPase subunit D/Vma8
MIHLIKIVEKIKICTSKKAADLFAEEVCRTEKSNKRFILPRSINSLEYKILPNVRMIEVKYISQNQNRMIEDLIIDF